MFHKGIICANYRNINQRTKTTLAIQETSLDHEFLRSYTCLWFPDSKAAKWARRRSIGFWTWQDASSPRTLFATPWEFSDAWALVDPRFPSMPFPTDRASSRPSQFQDPHPWAYQIAKTHHQEALQDHSYFYCSCRYSHRHDHSWTAHLQFYLVLSFLEFTSSFAWAALLS